MAYGLNAQAAKVKQYQSGKFSVKQILFRKKDCFYVISKVTICYCIKE